MPSIQFKFDAPRWIALTLALGGCVWAVLASVFIILSLFDMSMWGGALYFLCGFAVFFWWISRWRRVPTRRTSVIWWFGSFAVNVFFLFVLDSPFKRGSDGFSWVIGWWIFACIASLIAVAFEIFLNRRVHDA
jgi:hypothetical protein